MDWYAFKDVPSLNNQKIAADSIFKFYTWFKKPIKTWHFTKHNQLAADDIFEFHSYFKKQNMT